MMKNKKINVLSPVTEMSWKKRAKKNSDEDDIEYIYDQSDKPNSSILNNECYSSKNSDELKSRSTRNSLLDHINPQSPKTPIGSRITTQENNRYMFFMRKDQLLGRGPDQFSKLSDEIILMVFKKLDKQTLINCACTCQRWKNIAYDNDLWCRIDISYRKIVPDGMVHILYRSPYALRMAQTEVTYPMFDKLSHLMENYVSRLEYLDLSMAIIESTDLCLLLSKCRNLLKLSLENCILDNNICHEISRNLHLTVLNMSSCYKVPGTGLKVVLEQCVRLEELNIAWNSLSSETITMICSTLTVNIQKLNMSGCLKELEDIHVSCLSSRCSQLTELDLSDCTVITEDSLDCIIKYLDNIQHLSLSRCYNIRPTKYLSLFEKASLKYLNIFGLFQERNIETLQRNSAHIQLNAFRFSYIARPTVGIRRTSIWGLVTRNC